MFTLIALLVCSVSIGILFAIYTWQELKKKSNNNVPKRFKKISIILGVTVGASFYALCDIIISIVYLIVGI